jgi:hypothetical protein
VQVEIPYNNVFFVAPIQLCFPYGFLEFLDPWNVCVAWFVIYVVYVYSRATRLDPDVYREGLSRTVY